jgi:alpha-glucosidase (family GH31 glycosyl hydrolase)
LFLFKGAYLWQENPEFVSGFKMSLKQRLQISNMMKQLSLFLFLLLSVGSFAQQKFHPVANPASVVTSGNTRFTVLCSGLIRMEWDSTAKFEDHASFVAINRDLPKINFTKKEDDKSIRITTSKLELLYIKSKGRFTADNLSISFVDKNNKTVWKPGTPNTGNLLGTTRTLDGYNGNKRSNGDTLKLEQGIISKDGWYVIDDSKNFLFDNSDWPWVMPRENQKRQDLYFFGYGLDYKAALYDFTQLSGKIPLPPKYAFGYWWSRYWSYTDQELRELEANMERYDLPLDVLVIDMDWHITDRLSSRNGARDEFGQQIGWTGYTWNKNLFPDPGKFLQWTKEKNLTVTMNLHPASGVAPWEDSYPAMAKAMDFDTTGKKNIPFEIADKKYTINFFNIVLHPLEKQGADFWWLDWQQWPYSKKVPNLSNTWWLNYCFFTEMERQGVQRPMLYHRWGGLGNHRYQIGFSGDTYISWASLAYQPYFTATASNVGYGYWSHDIGGHQGEKGIKMNPELTTRWTQFGVFSPILRHHSTKNPAIYKEAWLYPFEYECAMHDAINLRYTLFPYIYTYARKAFDTGLSLLRPMYYDYPAEPEAYTSKNQYFFGDDMIVAPIISPAAEGENQAKVNVWLPKGQWYEWYTGTMLEGGMSYERSFLINEIPVYVRSGAIVPMYPKVKNLKEKVEELDLTIFPGGGAETKVYEDNGFDNAYTKGEYAFTKVKSTRSGNSLSVIINPRSGKYAGAPVNRSYHLKFYGSYVPTKVLVDGKEYTYAPSDKAISGNWTYTTNDLTVHVYIPKRPTTMAVAVNITFPQEAVNNNLINGKIGMFNRYDIASRFLKVEFGFTDNAPLPAVITKTEQTATRIGYNPKTIIEELKQFDAGLKLIPAVVNGMNIKQNVKDQFFNYLK